MFVIIGHDNQVLKVVLFALGDWLTVFIYCLGCGHLLVLFFVDDLGDWEVLGIKVFLGPDALGCGSSP